MERVLNSSYFPIILCAAFLSGACQKSSSDALATVGSIKITPADFVNDLHTAPLPVQNAALTPEGRMAALKNLIDRMKIVVLVNQANIGTSPGNGTVLRAFEASHLLQSYRDYLRPKIAIPDQEVRGYYDSHPQEFMEGPVSASHIVTRSYDDARKVSDLLAKNEPFAQAARELSTDRASAEHGGKMAATPLGKMDPRFAEIFRTLPNGEVSKIFKIAADYEIIRKDGDTPGPEESFEKAAPGIQVKLQDQKIDQQINAEETALPVHIDENALKAIDFSPATPVAARAPGH